jgi:hypothetical protein
MMAFSETYAALVKHLQDSFPAGTELTDAQHELLGSAASHLNLLQIHSAAALNAQPLIEDLLSVMEQPGQLTEAKPGLLLMAHGIEQVAEFASSACSLLIPR